MENNRLPPSNNLVWAILTTLFCCMPLGVMSIIHSCKADDMYNAEQYDKAVEEANKAAAWAIWALIAGIIASGVIVPICEIVMFAVAAALHA